MSNNSERIVIVAYKPFKGKDKELVALMRTHLTILREQGLVTDRESIIMRSEDGTIVEVFGWKSKEAINSAHTNPAVLKMWEDYSKVCEYLPVGNLSESAELFSEFTAIS
jgi:hypothetical protein